MSSSVHIDNKNKDILLFDGGPTQRLDDTILIGEAMYRIIFTPLNIMLQKYINSKQKTLK